eukprot:gene40230-66871_t
MFGPPHAGGRWARWAALLRAGGAAGAYGATRGELPRWRELGGGLRLLRLSLQPSARGGQGRDKLRKEKEAAERIAADARERENQLRREREAAEAREREDELRRERDTAEAQERQDRPRTEREAVGAQKSGESWDHFRREKEAADPLERVDRLRKLRMAQTRDGQRHGNDTRRAETQWEHAGAREREGRLRMEMGKGEEDAGEVGAAPGSSAAARRSLSTCDARPAAEGATPPTPTVISHGVGLLRDAGRTAAAERWLQRLLSAQAAPASPSGVQVVGAERARSYATGLPLPCCWEPPGSAEQQQQRRTSPPVAAAQRVAG